jgi:nesprin-1
LQKDQKTYREFVSAHGAAVIGLTQVDVMLTQLQHLATPEQKALPRRRLQQLGDVETELSKQNANLRRADELALQVMSESHADDVAGIQELVDEYQLLWKDIKKRVELLRAEIEAEERQEVDEAVQVETLKFEKDTAVQVDTLPQLTKMTAFDAYLIELEAAISEFKVALDALETAVLPEPTPGTGLSSSARNIVSLTFPS